MSRPKKRAALPKAQSESAALLHRIREIWNAARSHAARSVNTAHVSANWLIGQQIVEAEQGGKARAGYGKQLLQTLSAELGVEYGEGFSVSALQYMRAFYLAYPELLEIQHAVRGELGPSAGSPIQHAVRGESGRGTALEIRHAVRDESKTVANTAWKPGRLHGGLSWTHYRALLKVERRAARDFYEIEAVRAGWSAR